MLSDVAVSFHCMSPSSALCLGDTAAEIQQHGSLLYMKHTVYIYLDYSHMTS